MENLPAQALVCSFCCFIKDVLDYHCQEAGHSWPTALPIKGEPVKAPEESSSRIQETGADDENYSVSVTLPFETSTSETLPIGIPSPEKLSTDNLARQHSD